MTSRCSSKLNQGQLSIYPYTIQFSGMTFYFATSGRSEPCIY